MPPPALIEISSDSALMALPRLMPRTGTQVWRAKRHAWMPPGASRS
jgi:hypothetical protein